MNATERMQHILMADPTKLAQIDAILTGKATQSERHAETRLITISEAAKMLSVSRPTLYRFIESGRLDAIDLNGIRRVRLQSVLDFSMGLRPRKEVSYAS